MVRKVIVWLILLALSGCMDQAVPPQPVVENGRTLVVLNHIVNEHFNPNEILNREESQSLTFFTFDQYIDVSLNTQMVRYGNDLLRYGEFDSLYFPELRTWYSDTLTLISDTTETFSIDTGLTGVNIVRPEAFSALEDDQSHRYFILLLSPIEYSIGSKQDAIVIEAEGVYRQFEFYFLKDNNEPVSVNVRYLDDSEVVRYLNAKSAPVFEWSQRPKLDLNQQSVKLELN